MSLYSDWKELAEIERDQREHDKFWSEYFALETENYKKLLAAHTEVKQGKASELAEYFGMDEVTFLGFLDGINTSLKTELKLDSIKSGTNIALDIDYEKLYFNMLDCKADWLYSLAEWDNILTPERRHEISREYRASRMYISPKKVGRNDPCPCGSGKKYKNCCGKATE